MIASVSQSSIALDARADVEENEEKAKRRSIDAFSINITASRPDHAIPISFPPIWKRSSTTFIRKPLKCPDPFKRPCHAALGYFILHSFPANFHAITPCQRHSFHSHHLIMSLPSSTSGIHEFALSNGYIHAIGQPLDDQSPSHLSITSFSPPIRPTIRTGKKLVIESSHNSRTVYYGFVKSVIRLEHRHISFAVEPRREAYGDFLPLPIIIRIPLSIIRLSLVHRLQHFIRFPRPQHDNQEPHVSPSAVFHSPAQAPSQSPAELPSSSLDFLDLSSSIHSL